MTSNVPALIILVLCALIAVQSGGSAAVQAQPTDPEVAVQVERQGVVLRLTWSDGGVVAADPPLPQLTALRLPADGDPAPRLLVLHQTAWIGNPPIPTALPLQALPDGTVVPPLPDATAPVVPSAPISLVREGWLRGRRIAVYALSPVYQTDEGIFRVRYAEALVADAEPVEASTLALLDTQPFSTDAPAPDPIAAGPAWKINVTAPGIQELGAAELAAVGLDLSQVDPATLRLSHRGRGVPLEYIRDGSGALTALRFYAVPGDRWNATAVYWLTVGRGAGTPMVERAADPSGAEVLSEAFEQGVWRSNQILETRLPGPDGDYFFSADLRVVPPPGEPDAVVVRLTPILPPIGPPALTLQGATLRSGTFALAVGSPATVARWIGQGLWSVQVRLPAFAEQVSVALLPQLSADRVHLDSVMWEVPAALTLNGQGAVIKGRAGRYGYRLSSQAADATVYDVTDPLVPVRLRFSGDTFEDNPSTPRTYLITGPGTLHRPAIAVHTPADVSRPLNVRAVYIAPAVFLEALEPLLAHRRAQGLTVAAVAVETLYDAWSGGEVDPEAIRSFLRYAAERWTTAPEAVILVGDGTADPRNYLGRNNRNWIPPYLTRADPWLGDTACESCFVRLHGMDPLQDPLPDLWLGRLPAKSVEEVTVLVAKILAYERDNTPGIWRSRLAYIADNPDSAGNFIAKAEESIALHPARTRIIRVYFDPDAPPTDPWRERDPLAALARTLRAFDDGAAFVTYLGHGLQFQWAYTGPPLQPGAPQDRQYLLGLFEVDDLRNNGRLPVVLAMTCLSGAFQTPAFTGTSIDERLVVRPDGGAIASWSSTGLGVLYGHDALQRGFYRALWTTTPPPLGALTLAGYLELFNTSLCCQETAFTYALLGDPLTSPRVDLDRLSLYLPLVRQ